MASLRETLSRTAARVWGSRFAKPLARITLAAAGLVLLAIVGRTAVAGALAGPAPPPSEPALLARAGAERSSAPAVTAVPTALAATANQPGHPAAETVPGSVSLPSARASPEDPVLLNSAEASDLRRLPGIGEKRALAILTLRARLGRFRAIEDLLKVKGIGRAMLKRLRPLVRLDPAARPADAGS